MFDLATFTPWSLFRDAGIIFALLLIGKLCRAKLRFIQSLFIPPSLVAGILALAFGPNGLGWLPLSNNLGTYSAILIAVVFASLPLASPPIRMTLQRHRRLAHAGGPGAGGHADLRPLRGLRGEPPGLYFQRRPLLLEK